MPMFPAGRVASRPIIGISPRPGEANRPAAGAVRLVAAAAFCQANPDPAPFPPPATVMTSTPLFLGLDVGGTTMKAGVVADDGRPLTEPVSLPTDAPRGQEHG